MTWAGWMRRCPRYDGFPESTTRSGATAFRKTRQCFFERRGIGVMTDGGHHGEGEHDQRDMPMPAMPGAGLVVIEAEFVLGGLEAVLDGPAMAFHRD